jgi:hypothetical protein
LAEYLDDVIKPEEIPRELYDKTIESLPGKGRWGRLVVLCESDVQGSWLGAASKEKKGEVSLRYKSNEGLLVGEKECGEP